MSLTRDESWAEWGKEKSGDSQGSQWHKEKIEDPKYRHMVERKLSELFDTPCQVRCILAERRKPSQEPMVRAALELGGRVVNEENHG